MSALQLTAAVNVSTNPENRKHFFDNPHRYDSETEELLYGSYQRSRYDFRSWKVGGSEEGGKGRCMCVWKGGGRKRDS